MPPFYTRRLASLWIAERTVLSVIVLNAVVLFLDAFPKVHRAVGGWLEGIDYGCMVFFVIEAGLKISRGGFRQYWRSGWNRIDFVIVMGSLPLLAGPFVAADLSEFAVLLLLRLGRLLRFSRLLRFVPNASEIWRGVLRALKASVAVILIMFILNLIFALGATLLFGQHEATQAFFGDPLIAFYSLFKVFTIEGWYEIPDQLASSGAPAGLVFWLRGYFVVAVLIGGLLGLSLANAVFVDEMTADNTRQVERMVTELRSELQAFREEMRARDRLEK